MDSEVFANYCLYGYEESTIETYLSSVYFQLEVWWLGFVILHNRAWAPKVWEQQRQVFVIQILCLRRVAFLSKVLKRNQLTHVFQG